MKPYLIMGIVIVALILILVILILEIRKLGTSKKQYENQIESYKTTLREVEENIVNARKEKEKLNTGDDLTDFANGLNILQEYANKKR